MKCIPLPPSFSLACQHCLLKVLVHLNHQAQQHCVNHHHQGLLHEGHAKVEQGKPPMPPFLPLTAPHLAAPKQQLSTQEQPTSLSSRQTTTGSKSLESANPGYRVCNYLGLRASVVGQGRYHSPIQRDYCQLYYRGSVAGIMPTPQAAMEVLQAFVNW